MVLVFGSFAASLGGKNRFRLCHKRSTHWVQGMLSSPPHPPLTSCVASNMCAKQGMWSSPTSCVASNMCASARNVIIPPPPTPDQLRSIQHVCKCKERYHPPPHPPLTSCVASNMCAKQGMLSSPTCCVASNMCASARNVIIPPPTHPWPVA